MLKAKDQEMSRRVIAIKQIANRIANGDYNQRVVDNAEDDLGELVESLNNMTESLKLSFDTINKSDWRQKGLAILNESLVGNKSVKGRCQRIAAPVNRIRKTASMALSIFMMKDY